MSIDLGSLASLNEILNANLLKGLKGDVHSNVDIRSIRASDNMGGAGTRTEQQGQRSRHSGGAGLRDASFNRLNSVMQNATEKLDFDSLSKTNISKLPSVANFGEEEYRYLNQWIAGHISGDFCRVALLNGRARDADAETTDAAASSSSGGTGGDLAQEMSYVRLVGRLVDVNTVDVAAAAGAGAKASKGASTMPRNSIFHKTPVACVKMILHLLLSKSLALEMGDPAAAATAALSDTAATVRLVNELTPEQMELAIAMLKLDNYRADAASAATVKDKESGDADGDSETKEPVDSAAATTAGAAIIDNFELDVMFELLKLYPAYCERSRDLLGLDGVDTTASTEDTTRTAAAAGAATTAEGRLPALQRLLGCSTSEICRQIQKRKDKYKAAAEADTAAGAATAAEAGEPDPASAVDANSSSTPAKPEPEPEFTFLSNEELERENVVLRGHLDALDGLKRRLAGDIRSLRDSESYVLLGLVLAPGAPRPSLKEIKRAYHRLAIKLHPDRKGGDKAQFQELQAAYQEIVKGRKEEGGGSDGEEEAESDDDDDDEDTEDEGEDNAFGMDMGAATEAAFSGGRSAASAAMRGGAMPMPVPASGAASCRSPSSRGSAARESADTDSGSDGEAEKHQSQSNSPADPPTKPGARRGRSRLDVDIEDMLADLMQEDRDFLDAYSDGADPDAKPGAGSDDASTGDSAGKENSANGEGDRPLEERERRRIRLEDLGLFEDEDGMLRHRPVGADGQTIDSDVTGDSDGDSDGSLDSYGFKKQKTKPEKTKSRAKTKTTVPEAGEDSDGGDSLDSYGFRKERKAFGRKIEQDTRDSCRDFGLGGDEDGDSKGGGGFGFDKDADYDWTYKNFSGAGPAAPKKRYKQTRKQAKRRCAEIQQSLRVLFAEVKEHSQQICSIAQLALQGLRMLEDIGGKLPLGARAEANSDANVFSLYMDVKKMLIEETATHARFGTLISVPLEALCKKVQRLAQESMNITKLNGEDALFSSDYGYCVSMAAAKSKAYTTLLEDIMGAGLATMQDMSGVVSADMLLREARVSFCEETAYSELVGAGSGGSRYEIMTQRRMNAIVTITGTFRRLSTSIRAAAASSIKCVEKAQYMVRCVGAIVTDADAIERQEKKARAKQRAEKADDQYYQSSGGSGGQDEEAEGEAEGAKGDNTKQGANRGPAPGGRGPGGFPDDDDEEDLLGGMGTGGAGDLSRLKTRVNTLLYKVYVTNLSALQQLNGEVLALQREFYGYLQRFDRRRVWRDSEAYYKQLAGAGKPGSDADTDTRLQYQSRLAATFTDLVESSCASVRRQAAAARATGSGERSMGEADQAAAFEKAFTDAFDWLLALVADCKNGGTGTGTGAPAGSAVAVHPDIRTRLAWLLLIECCASAGTAGGRSTLLDTAPRASRAASFPTGSAACDRVYHTLGVDMCGMLTDIYTPAPTAPSSVDVAADIKLRLSSLMQKLDSARAGAGVATAATAPRAACTPAGADLRRHIEERCHSLAVTVLNLGLQYCLGAK